MDANTCTCCIVMTVTTTAPVHSGGRSRQRLLLPPNSNLPNLARNLLLSFIVQSHIRNKVPNTLIPSYHNHLPHCVPIILLLLRSNNGGGLPHRRGFRSVKDHLHAHAKREDDRGQCWRGRGRELEEELACLSHFRLYLWDVRALRRVRAQVWCRRTQYKCVQMDKLREQWGQFGLREKYRKYRLESKTRNRFRVKNAQ
jgi:hypothetical protein